MSGWIRATSQIERLPVNALANELGWSYTEKKNEQAQIYAGWVNALKDWAASCYPMPADRTINTGDKICQNGIDYATIKKGESDAKAMWEDFFEPLLEQYKKSENFNQATYDEVRKVVGNTVYEKGEFQSFYLEWKFIRTRVRYFELIPNWEIERVRDDVKEHFVEVEAFRNQLVNELGVSPTGIYSEATLNEMRDRKDKLVLFLNNWVMGKDVVYDHGAERQRNTLRALTAEAEDEATEIYKWHWKMAWRNWEWKEGMPHDLNKDHFKWTPKSRVARAQLFESRKGFKKDAREMKKFNFHLKRRI